VTFDPRMREATSLMLTEMQEAGFVLAGSAALNQHRLTERPVGDIDLFTTMPMTREHPFHHAVLRGVDTLRRHGFGAEPVPGKQGPYFASYVITAPDGHAFGVDMGVDYRANPPDSSDVGPMLSEEDAVAGKINAIYTRDSMKDVVDLDTIRRSGRYTNEQLLQLGEDRDGGFDRRMFGQNLNATCHRPFDDGSLGLPVGRVQAARDRVSSWAAGLATGRQSGSPEIGLVSASYPYSAKHVTRQRGTGAVAGPSAAGPYRPQHGRDTGRGR
jgi:hypothetical protein